MTGQPNTLPSDVQPGADGAPPARPLTPPVHGILPPGEAPILADAAIGRADGGLLPAMALEKHWVIASLLAQEPTSALIDAFLANHDFPLIEPGSAVFAFRGEAHHVHLVRWIHAGVDRVPFVRVPGSDLWLAHIEVEDGGRFEYKLAVEANGEEHWINDPLNSARAGDPFGENSVCQTYGYQRPAWSMPQGAPEGDIEPLPVPSETFGETREERLYRPAGHDPAVPHPLVVIHDGTDFVNYASLSVALDNLIAAGDIPPVVAALVQTRDRTGEYTGGRNHARYVAKELLPAIRSRVAVSQVPGERVLLGASLGAVASLATAFRYPGVFGGLILKSGSFIFDERKLLRRPHAVFHQVARFVKAVKRAPQLPPTRAFVSTGELEGLADENRALADFLRESGVDVQFQSAWDGHHWHNWRDQLRDGLMFVFGPRQRND